MTLVAGREPKLGLGVLKLRLHAPRDVSLRHLLVIAFESRRLPALAVALTVALAMFEYAAGRESRMGLTLRHALPIGLAGMAGACWSVVLGGLFRTHRLLGHGAPVVARVTDVRAPANDAGRGVRARVGYVADVAGRVLRSRAQLCLGPHERTPAAGDLLTLLVDPGSPTRHLVPRAHGFEIEGA